MVKPFHELRERLLRAGVAPRHVQRYLTELTDHLADLRAEEERAGRSRTDAESAALLRLGGIDDLANAMRKQRQFQSWSLRAPWAAFGLAPLLLLGASWYVALFLLWSGWRIFLPGSDSPFVRIDGLAIIYFGVGRLIFFGAPVLVGWGIALIAARQRLKPIWPAAGLSLIALMGATARVHVSRTAVPGGLGHVSMGLSYGSSVQIVSSALVILSLTVLPYLVWRLQRDHPLSTWFA